ncbi:aspartokinase II alpha subunit (aa 1-_408) [Candidatus Hydrogenisulfobacillus filiaventi]|uniref:Aspartokinase n=1 Tax=Candidatus Hydrogenisulfobacillus filiaventi TaxID=2707344 RepID=A0A6F8ZJD9_9FIRM|nr:aspartate kinase [Bacillota bacterium]CAB1130099.1 aspartokinase II alpha subunit (aa 1->408) [Candidatus Hydrogenisulfobacillus filiaventi]
MLLVQKFGGSSLATTDHIRRVAERVARTVAEGHQVVVVVSAMGDSTDDLLAKARDLSTTLPPREMDALLATGEMQSIALMAMALETAGVPARSFTGPQAGIRTDGQHGNARITGVEPRRLRQALALGLTPVVAGFQGEGPDGDITTLGRGGSDLTAIALAGALEADRCEIYSDVAGVFTADPRVVPDAAKLAHLPYSDMLELAAQGAQVLQTKAVEYAWDRNVTIHARSTFEEEDPGTVIDGHPSVTLSPVTAVALNTHIAKIGLTGVPDAPGVAARLFEALAAKGINVDLIIQSLSHDQLNDMAFTVAEADTDRAVAEAERVLAELHGRAVVVDRGVAKVSAVGTGMLGRPGVAARVFRALADAGINIELIGTSEIKISCLIAREHAHRALKAVHEAFNLGEGAIQVEE